MRRGSSFYRDDLPPPVPRGRPDDAFEIDNDDGPKLQEPRAERPRMRRASTLVATDSLEGGDDARHDAPPSTRRHLTHTTSSRRSPTGPASSSHSNTTCTNTGRAPSPRPRPRLPPPSPSFDLYLEDTSTHPAPQRGSRTSNTPRRLSRSGSRGQLPVEESVMRL